MVTVPISAISMGTCVLGLPMGQGHPQHRHMTFDRTDPDP